MPKFDMGKTRDLIWPDILGVGAGVGGHYLARGVDHAKGWTTPFKRLQDYVSLGMMGGSWALYCADKAPDFAGSWFGSNLTLLAEGGADKLFGPPEEAFAGLRTRKKTSKTLGNDAASPRQLPSGSGRTVNPIIVEEELLV